MATRPVDIHDIADLDFWMRRYQEVWNSGPPYLTYPPELYGIGSVDQEVEEQVVPFIPFWTRKIMRRFDNVVGVCRRCGERCYTAHMCADIQAAFKAED